LVTKYSNTHGLDCNVTDIGCIVMDWIHLALDRDIYLAVVMRVSIP